MGSKTGGKDGDGGVVILLSPGRYLPDKVGTAHPTNLRMPKSRVGCAHQTTELHHHGDELRRRAERLTHKLLASASGCFGVALPVPRVRFDLRGRNAGQARITEKGDYLVRYNAHLLERHPRAFLAQTVPHETAHLVAYGLFGPRVPSHGQEWRAIMTIFGAPSERCHSYDVDGLQTRHLHRYDYCCACRIHRLTSIRHNRIQAGQTYHCRRCGQPLERTKFRSILQDPP